jgi:hypothetical protein
LREKMKKECKATLIVKTDQYEIEIWHINLSSNLSY